MMDKKTIGRVMDKYRTDKGPWRHGYNQCYADVFKDFTPSSMLEIGIYEGRSLAAWRELLPDTTIHGLDTFKREVPLKFDPENVLMFTGNSLDPKITETLSQSYDIIIDDGDHRPDAQWGTFLNFKDKWTTYYVIEDVFGEDNEKLLRRRLKAHGFKNITTYRSAFQGNVMTKGVNVYTSFFAMVIKREE